MRYCEEYAALLDLFVDGELPPEEMARVQAHLAVCPGCRRYVDDVLAIRAGFPDVEDTAVPEGFTESVMERVRKESEDSAKAMEPRRRSVRRWTGTLAALAACCALVILVRTLPGGMSGGDASVTASSDSGSASAEYDMGEMEEEAGIEAQASPEKPESRQSMFRATVKSAGGAAEDAAGDIEEFCQVPAKADLEAAQDNVLGEEAALYLTAEEAGDLLEGFTPVWEDELKRGYELSAEEYTALLEALGRQGEPLEGESVLVVVTGPFE